MIRPFQVVNSTINVSSEIKKDQKQLRSHLCILTNTFHKYVFLSFLLWKCLNKDVLIIIYCGYLTNCEQFILQIKVDSVEIRLQFASLNVRLSLSNPLVVCLPYQSIQTTNQHHSDRSNWGHMFGASGHWPLVRQDMHV